MTITSNPASPIRTAGSSVTLTCTVKLNSVIDVPVTVNTMWTGPAGFMYTNTAQPVMGSNITYASTATVSSFGRVKSGIYTCTTTIHSATVFLTRSTAESATITLTTGKIIETLIYALIYTLLSDTHMYAHSGIYLSLKGNSYSNSSVIKITEIGERYNGLQCHTDRSPCCAYFYRAGEWYFPNLTLVPIQGRATTFYRNRGDDGTVNLNRHHDFITSPTGLFCCEVPDANNNTQKLCAYVGKHRLYHNQYVNHTCFGG